VRSQISDISLEERHVQSFMKVLDSHLSEDRWTNIIDLQPLFFRLTLDSATEFLFGESVRSQDLYHADASADNKTSFAYAFDRAQYMISIAGRYGSAYKMGHTKEFHQNVKIVHDFIDYFVQKALSQSTSEKNPDTTKDGYIFLDALSKETSDPIELRSQLVNILLAGRDTTASTLGWFFFTMANPKWHHVYDRLRAVVVENFGTYNDPKDITFEGLKSCQYLQWCVNECLRLYPVVPLNGRTATKDTVLPVGGGADGQSPVFISKGQDVRYSVRNIPSMQP
jgi:cytochrome P450